MGNGGAADGGENVYYSTGILLLQKLENKWSWVYYYFDMFTICLGGGIVYLY